LKRVAAAGRFRMPAEWEPHEATWLGWPHRLSDWPRKFAPIPWVYAEIVRKLVPGERVRILVQSAAHEAGARRVLVRAGVDLGRVDFFRFPTDRGWTRDFGPLFVRRRSESGVARLAGGALRPPQAPRRPGEPGSESGGARLAGGALRPAQAPHRLGEPGSESGGSEIAIARFHFNAWAKYPDWKKDDRVPERAARALGLRLRPALSRGRPVVLEGGSIDVNGRGTLLTTEECLLDPVVQVRNPGLSRADLELVLAEALGVTRVLWLGKGIAGDDTHGHVDDLCRFVGPRTVVLAREANPHDANYRPLEENRERLEGLRLADGSRPEVVALPMPAPLVHAGMRLPASYANFYVGNAAVLVPTFNDPADRVALGKLAELFSDRPVVGIHAVDLVWGLGTLHCLTQQQPAP
jgi:agmatine deiminase